MRFLSALLLAASLMAPVSAAASSAVLLPRVGGSGLDVAAQGAAADELARVLENEGWRVHRTLEVSEHLPGRLAACGPDDGCAHDLRALLGVDLAVGLRAWGERDTVEHVAVVVTGVRGVGHRAVATVTDEAPLPFALAEAARAALTLWSTGAAPVGARGNYELVDRHRDLDSFEATVLNWALGGLFVLGSAPMLGYGINSAVRSGECLTEGPAPNTCAERVTFSDGAATFTGIGAVTLALGLGIWFFQPIRIHVQGGEDSAMLQLSGTF